MEMLSAAQREALARARQELKGNKDAYERTSGSDPAASGSGDRSSSSAAEAVRTP